MSWSSFWTHDFDNTLTILWQQNKHAYFRLNEQRSVLTQLAAANKKQVATSHESIAKLEGLVEDLQKKVGQTIDTGDKVEDLQKKMGQIN